MPFYVQCGTSEYTLYMSPDALTFSLHKLGQLRICSNSS